MARIRTIKPEFFRHEELQDLEAENPGQHVMLVFAALWGHCDKNGSFAWKPRTMKLDILPFLDFDLSASLTLLCEAGLIKRYEVSGQTYGFIPTFREHQRISGKEAQESAKYPEFKDNPRVDSQGSNREAIGKHPERQEGKGREGKGINNTDVLFVASPADDHRTDPAEPGAAEQSAPVNRQRCPHQQIIDLYREILPTSPEIRDWTPNRAALLRTRWNEAPERQNLNWWRRFFGYIAESDFLTGKRHSADRKPFCAPLEWILKAENFAKIREGRYHQEAA